MEARFIALMMLAPFALMFIYLGFREYQRYKSQGRATYGLVYDEETGTTHVTGIAEGDDGYDPNEFDPADHNDRESKTEDGKA